ncbi:hypothetical protein [Streptosporangium sp. NPDC000396]|uniref:hypothetical protein n=1 Tax=Streptosporangium sp. NPDC000396 TaxID=3366185 RepID=UPI0036B2FE0A
MKQIVKRGAAVLAAGVAMAGALAVSSPASAATTTTTCSNTVLISGLNTKACVDVTGTQARFYGVVSAPGIAEPGPGGVITPQRADVEVSGQVVGGLFLGSRRQAVSIWNNSVTVEGVTATAPCGSTVRSEVKLSQGPVGPGGAGFYGPSSVSVDVPVSC